MYLRILLTSLFTMLMIVPLRSREFVAAVK